MDKIANYKEVIYKAAKEKKEKNPDKDALKYLDVAIGTAGANLGAVQASKLLMNKGSKLTEQEILDLARQKAQNLGFDDEDAIVVKITDDNAKSSASNAFYKRPDIIVGDNEFVIRHELGHIDDNVKRHQKIHDKKYLNKDSKYMQFMNDRIKTDKMYQQLKKDYDYIIDNIRADNINELSDAYDKKMRDFKTLESRVNDHHKFYVDELNKTKKRQMKNKKIGDNTMSLLHSKTVRDFVRKKNDGKIKAIDKTMDVMDNPIAASVILGGIKDSHTLKKEFAASLDATKGMVSKYGRKKGLAMSLPMFAAQFGSYGASAVAKEGLRGGIIRGGETLATKAVKKVKNKKESK